MSAGRLQLYDKRAGAARPHLAAAACASTDGRELRLREFGTKQAAWVKLLPPRGPGAGGDADHARPRGLARPAADLRPLLRAPRPLHGMLRDQRVIAGIGRSLGR